MSSETQVFRRAGSVIKEHRGTVVGGIGGASIVGVLAFVMPLFTDIREANKSQWEQISALKEQVTILKIKVELLEKSKQ